MKKLISIISLFTCSISFAASVTVNPFELEFYLESDSYEVDFELEMACRYEKFVIGDSAKFEYKFEKVPLLIEQEKMGNNLTKITLQNVSKRKLNLDGYFRSNKECQTIKRFFLKSKLYSIGWANQFHRPIRLGIYAQSRLAETKTFNIQKLVDEIGNKELGFIYRPVANQVNIRFAFDRIQSTGMSSYLMGTAYQDPSTRMPWPLIK